MINTIIIDDDIVSSKILNNFLAEINNVNVLATFNSPLEGIKFLNEKTVDLVFLDVEMPEINGFQLLDSLNNSQPRVIIVSAHENYALTAFKYNINDYLLKPFSREQLEKSLKKAIGLNSNLTNRDDDTHLFIKDGLTIHRINKTEVNFIQCIGDYAKVHTRNKKTYVVHSTMKSLIKRFFESNFVRVHRSYIINMNDIVDIEDNSILIKEKIIPIGKTYKKDFFSLVDTI